MNTINSVSNPAVKHLCRLKSKPKMRKEEGVFICEGFKMFMEAPDDLICGIYLREDEYFDIRESYNKAPLSFKGLVYEKISSLLDKGVKVNVLTDEPFNRISDTESPQGILIVLRMIRYELDDILNDDEAGNILILENIKDPGNLGTMIRTAEGAGISGIVMTDECVDIYNPKVIRSTMGSLFRVKFYITDDLEDTVSKIKRENITVYSARLDAESEFDRISYDKRCAFMIGNEARGLSEKAQELSDIGVIIPMKGKLESLNAAVAAALLMYQAR